MNSLKLVVFDWAGTLIDMGSKAPVEAFIALFAEAGIAISETVAKAPMGLGKRDHIKTILKNPLVVSEWNRVFGRPADDYDVDRLYRSYEPHQIQAIRKFSQLIPGAMESVSWLRKRGIKVAGTTGYPRSVASLVWKEAKDQGLELDANACNCDVAYGRPSPLMIFKVMELTNLYPPSSVLKVGDTIPDVMEGKNAGCKTFSVLKTGSGWEGETSRKSLTNEFEFVGTDKVIDSVADLPGMIENMKGY